MMKSLSVSVTTTDLLTKLRENAATHHAGFLKAEAAFRERAIELLDDRLTEARGGGPVRLRFGLPVPEDHTDDYKRAIAMLEMSINSTIGLDTEQYRRLVDDEWEWKQGWTQTTRFYGAGNDEGDE